MLASYPGSRLTPPRLPANQLASTRPHDSRKPPALGLRHPPASRDLHHVTQLGLVLLIVGVERRRSSHVLAVLGMLNHVLIPHLNRLIPTMGHHRAHPASSISSPWPHRHLFPHVRHSSKPGSPVPWAARNQPSAQPPLRRDTIASKWRWIAENTWFPPGEERKSKRGKTGMAKRKG